MSSAIAEITIGNVTITLTKTTRKYVLRATRGQDTPQNASGATLEEAVSNLGSPFGLKVDGLLERLKAAKANENVN